MSTRNEFIKEYLALCKERSAKDLAKAPTWIIELAVAYCKMRADGNLRTETEWSMHGLCTRLDVEGVKKRTDIWKYMVVRDAEGARARHKRPEVEPPKDAAHVKRPTAAAIVLDLLREKPVRSDAKIIQAVNAATLHDGFNAKQLAWYKSQFRRGLLKGQNGEHGVINESGGPKSRVSGPQTAQTASGQSSESQGPKKAIV